MTIWFYRMTTEEAQEAFNEADDLSFGELHELQNYHGKTVFAGWEEMPYCNPGDYNNSCSVERANFKWIEEWIAEKQAKGLDTRLLIKTIWGDFSSKSAYWNANDTRESCQDCENAQPEHGPAYAQCSYHEAWEELRDVVEGLHDYPSIDDDNLSQLEMEEQDQEWASWARNDFKSAMLKHWVDDEPENWPQFAYAQESQIDQMFYELSEEANEYWESTGDGQWIDVEKIAKGGSITWYRKTLIRDAQGRPIVPLPDDVSYKHEWAGKAGFVYSGTATAEIIEPDRIEPAAGTHGRYMLDHVIGLFDLGHWPRYEVHPKSYPMLRGIETLWHGTGRGIMGYLSKSGPITFYSGPQRPYTTSVTPRQLYDTKEQIERLRLKYEAMQAAEKNREEQKTNA